MTTRPGDRADDQLRPVGLEIGVLKYAEGSALITMGDTRVLVAATIENRVPPFLVDSGKGWATAEYAMLPRATSTRSPRAVSRGRPDGRATEIQRLIGRSLRAVLDLTALGERTLILDCDVLQADGGTRTAAITGTYAAAVQALAQPFLTRELSRWPLREQLAAVSVGVVEESCRLDLEAVEDQAAAVDMNIVATTAGRLIEVQGTGEQRTFSREELDRLLDLALQGIQQLGAVQTDTLRAILDDVEARRTKGNQRAAEPKDEREIWGRP